MKHVVLVTAIGVLCAGCASERPGSPVQPDQASAVVAVSSAAGSAAGRIAGAAVKMQTADVIDVTQGGAVAGLASLLRNDKGISVDVSTTGLVPNEVYTLWWIIYPPGCADPLGCIVTNASGAVTDSKGRAHFAAHLSIGPVGPADGSVTLAAGDFENPKDSEVVLVIHHHGPKIPKLVGRMLSTFDVGCADGCVDDPQFADFPPAS
jgi:hypothetical protein